MSGNTLTFDGIAYPDGESSDPKALGLMQGTPPAPDKRVVFSDDHFLEFPQIRWSLSHMRELVPSRAVWRGTGLPSDLGTPPQAQEAIDAFRFADMAGRETSWSQALLDTYTDGVLVLHRGRRVYERYFGELTPERPHACFSITKSYVATLAATLVHEGVLDERRPVPYYLPEMRGTAYEDASLREVLDMQVGVAYSEAYAEPAANIWEYARAGGMRPLPAGYTGPRNVYDYLVTLKKEGRHGEAFAYKTVNTEVVGWIMSRVTGEGLAEMVSRRIWSQIGCEEDGFVSVDPLGVAMGGGGMSATLRDLARFGELMRREGDFDGRQVVPAQVVSDIRRGADPGRFAKAGYTLLPGYSYRNMWWVSHNELGAFEARGIHGQRLYVAPKAEMVVARFGSHPIAASAANDPITLPAFLALARMLTGA